MMFWYGAGGWSFWQVALMWAGMLAFWGLVVWAVYALAASAGNRGSQDSSGQPRRILDGRLARGEIGAEEYSRVRDLLAAEATRSPDSVEGRP